MKLQYLIIIFILFIACNQTDKIPSDIYNREQMALIMKDIYVLEFKVPELYLEEDSAKEVYNIFEKKLFEDKGYDSLKYRKSLEYYLNHPEHLEEIYTIIADSLSLEDRMNRL